MAAQFVLLMAVSLWAMTAQIEKPQLRRYFLSVFLSSLALFVVSLAGFSIHSHEYAIAYSIFRLLIIVMAFGYTMSEARGKWYLLVLLLIPTEFFLYMALPIARYYLWITALRGVAFAALGITLLAMGSGTVNRLLAALWLLQAIDSYGFTKFIPTDYGYVWWWLNWWEPTALTVIFFSVIGWQLRWTKKPLLA